MAKIEKEKKTVSIMIDIYCQKVHKVQSLCSDCNQLKEYTHNRLDKCQFGEEKSSCKKCSTHCYNNEMRQKIKQVMCYSGPRMLYVCPLYYVRHFLLS